MPNPAYGSVHGPMCYLDHLSPDGPTMNHLHELGHVIGFTPIAIIRLKQQPN